MREILADDGAIYVHLDTKKSHYIKAFLDEVTSSLDGHLKQKVVDYFVAEKNWTCLVNSHDSIWRKSPCVKIFDLEEGRWKP